MDQKKLIEQIRELVKQFNGETQVFFMAYDDNDLITFGYGCRACMMEAIIENMIKNPIVHNELKTDKTRVN